MSGILPIHHYHDVPWASLQFKPTATQQFVQQFLKLTTKNTSKLCITLCWLPPHKGPVRRKACLCYSVVKITMVHMIVISFLLPAAWCGYCQQAVLVFCLFYEVISPLVVTVLTWSGLCFSLWQVYLEFIAMGSGKLHCSMTIELITKLVASVIFRLVGLSFTTFSTIDGWSTYTRRE